MQNQYNLRKIREIYNLNQAEFAEALGVSREYMNKMENGKFDVKKKVALKLQQFLDARQGDESFPELDVLGQAHPEPVNSRIPYYQQRREKKAERLILEVPLVAQKAQAGYAKSYDQVDYIDSLEKYALPPGVNGTGAVWSYFEVDGDSMEPTFYAGDIVLASMLPHEDWNDVKNFCVYVILAGDQLLIKRVYRKSPDMWVLVSDNEEQYPQFLLPVLNIKQVWTFRRHIRSKAAAPRDFRITA